MELEKRRHRAGGMSLALSTALSTALSVTGLASVVAPAAADTGDGTVLVRVVQEVNANGTWDQALEPGLAGVTVTLTDTAGHTVTGTTQADGTVRLSPGTTLTGGKYRIEAKNPKPGTLFPGFAAPKPDLSNPNVLSSNVEFVDVSGGHNAEVTTSFWRPDDYCQKNATLVTACQNAAIPPQNPRPDSSRTLTSFPFNARGAYNQLTDLANNGQTGTVWGIGYNKVTKQIFSAAYAKRGTKYGPGGPGAIYRTDPATKQTTLFTTVPDPGTTAHNPNDRMDEAFGPVVGKESLGDVDVTPDGKDLYVVNMHDRKLYRYDATQTTAAAPKASYPIPDPGCASPDDWRPYGLGIQDGKVYAGGVCSGESTHSKTDMRAAIQVFDQAAGRFTGTAMNQPLNYPRGGFDTTVGNYSGICPGYGWYPWTETRPTSQDGRACTEPTIQNPEPELDDINFETNGDMVVSFGDRLADRGGANLPASSTSAALNVFQGGDINRACPGADGTFVLDANGGCVNHANAQTNGGREPLNVKEFYPGDYAWAAPWHEETAEGGVAIDKVETSIPFVAEDPITDPVTGHGVAWIDRATGRRTPEGNYLNADFGKARGMGDLEVLCDLAPVQIGNRVWFDKNNNGIQDADENGVPGVTVNLYDADGNKIGSTTTNARGEYYFSSQTTPALKPGTTYTLKMDNPADYSAGGPLDGWAPTKPNQGSNDQTDSDGTGSKYPSLTVTPQGPGQDDHSKDFGFRRVADLSVIKVAGPAQEVAEGDKIDYDLIVTNNGPSPSTGFTLTDTLPTGLKNPTTTADGCTITAGTLTCHGGPLAVGESHTIKVRGIAGRTDGNCVKLDNTVTVTGNEPDPDPDNNTDNVTTKVDCIPLIDPTISAAAATLLTLSGSLLIHRRRRTTTRRTA